MVGMQVPFSSWITGPITGEMFTKITHISSMSARSNRIPDIDPGVR